MIDIWETTTTASIVVTGSIVIIGILLVARMVSDILTFFSDDEV